MRSGAVNAGPAFDLRAFASADRSTYAGILRLVEQAQRERAPFVRLADRYALIFVPVTLVLAILEWAISGDAVRALAVLVVATPCPLILAAPIAIVAGISRAAKRGIIVKGGGALEALARGRVLTSKHGDPSPSAIDPASFPPTRGKWKLHHGWRKESCSSPFQRRHRQDLRRRRPAQLGAMGVLFL